MADKVLKIRSIEHAALLIALCVTLVVIVAGSIVTGIYHFFLWALLVIVASTFVVTYLFARLVMRKFVIYKMKPIYQIVFERNMKTRELENTLIRKDNLLEVVSAEIGDWAERNQMQIERLEENERYRRDYLGNVAHEIKTPVFNIQGYVSTLLDGAMYEEDLSRRYLERTEKSIERLINIVNDLDEISKLESGQPDLEYDSFDIIALAREIIEAFEIEAEAAQIKVSIKANSPSNMPVTGDRRLIGQVFVNLISNSIRYGRQGGATRISFVDMFDKVMVEVADNGEGIGKDDIPRGFERFYRTDRSRSREKGGTGLGLSIVKHILEAHGETISLRSELGKGSTFSFTVSKI
jgi:two-component system phosphate regulon sensor histidine kinase PhoR